jgi:DNA-binding MarR family transcriptional regulator
MTSAMSPRRPSIPVAQRTPQALLSEAGLRGIVGYQLAQASIVTDKVFEDTVGRRMDVRPVEFTMLALVQANDGVTARQLARALAVSPPNIAVWLDRLESRGWVERQRSAADGRLQHIRITADGAALASRAAKALLEAEQLMLAGLSAAERAMLVELLHKAAQARQRRDGEV